MGGLGSQWVGMGRGLLKFEVFRVGIESCQNVLDGLGADLNISHILCDEVRLVYGLSLKTIF